MQQPESKPMTSGQAIQMLWNLLLIFFVSHDYAASCYLHYGHALWPPIGAKLVAICLPAIHAFGWSVYLSYHPQSDPAFYDFRALFATYMPTLALVVFRSIQGIFNNKDHSRSGGRSYLAWLFGGGELTWQRLECLMLLLASPFCVRWGYPLAGLIASMGVSMAFMDAWHHSGLRKIARGRRDAGFEGEQMMG